MRELIEQNELAWIGLPLALLLLLLIAWLLVRRYQRRSATVGQVVRRISFDYLSNVIVPNGDEGEIHLDHVLLTTGGVLIIEVKNVEGIVFGGDKMQDWSVIAKDRRYTFANPQPGMFDRIAAVRHIVRDIPVSGKILFLDGAEFTKGTPGLVTTLDDLLSEFGEADKHAASAKIDAFMPQWERIRDTARSSTQGSVARRRQAVV